MEHGLKTLKCGEEVRRERVSHSSEFGLPRVDEVEVGVTLPSVNCLCVLLERVSAAQKSQVNHRVLVTARDMCHRDEKRGERLVMRALDEEGWRVVGWDRISSDCSPSSKQKEAKWSSQR